MIKYILALLLILSLIWWFIYYKSSHKADNNTSYTQSQSGSIINETDAWEVKHSGWWDTP